MKKYLLIILTIFIGTKAWSQTEEATTRSGKKVILYSDGTWKYADADSKTVKKDTEEKKKDPDKKTLPNPLVITGDCSDNLENVEDPRTRVITTRSRNMIIVAEKDDRKEINISMQKGAKDVISIIFHLVGAGQCIGDGNKINIVFTDGSRLDLINDFSNCRGESTANFGGNYGRKKPFAELQTKKIKSIKVWTSEGSLMQNLSPANQEEFQQMLNCLTKQ